MRKLIIDSMHGKLARYLRILGVDVLYVQGAMDDSEIVRECRDRQAGKTIVITGDRQLYMRLKKTGCNTLYLKPSTPLEIALLATLMKTALPVDTSMSNTRCPYCNEPLVQVENPPLPWVRRRVYRCPSCGNYYWRGSHWNNIDATLKRVLKWLKAQ